MLDHDLASKPTVFVYLGDIIITMPSVTTQNLSMVLSQVAQPQTQAAANASNNQNINPNQLAQLSRISADKQLSNPKRNDKDRSVQVAKRVEAAFAPQASKAVSKKPSSAKDPELEAKVKDDGLMDVVA